MATSPKALVLVAPGINCDRETALAFEQAGAAADRVHINDIIAEPGRLNRYQILAFAGGFSFGDDIASGQVLAAKLKHRLVEPLDEFIHSGKLILGICNGFQVLVKLGLLPAAGGDYTARQAALTFNASAKFEDRWVYLSPGGGSRCVFTRGIDRLMYLPVRHGEGRFVPETPELLESLKNDGQIALRYVDNQGLEAGYPDNPNGSIDGIAGICDPTGRIFGLMPHPEVFIRPTQHPRWTRGEGKVADGIEFFQNGVSFFHQ